jgi:16S rRNA (guanine(527)-N(7))-methyltransferase GidB
MLYYDYKEFEVFNSKLVEWGLFLTEKQKQQFIDYYEFLIERNNVMNLTAITEFNDVMNKHFIDSLSMIKVIGLKNEKILDLGTGAGFPGIPLKIVYPDIDILLLDSLNKRIKFLDEVIEKLDLKKISTLHGRAEDFGRNINYREKYDICVSRAVAKLSILAEYCMPFVKRNGNFISYKSGNIDEETANSEGAIKKLGGEIIKTEDFILPGTDIERKLVVIQKYNYTPKIYPRNAGKPEKEPL